MIFNENGDILNEDYIILKYINQLDKYEYINEAWSNIKAGVETLIRKMVDWIKDLIDWIERIPNFKNINLIKKNKDKIKENQKNLIIDEISPYFKADGYKNNKWIENFKNACILVKSSPHISPDNIEDELYREGSKENWFQGNNQIEDINIDDIIEFGINIKKFIRPLREAYSEVKVLNASLSHGEKINRDLISVLYKYLADAITTIKNLSKDCIKICVDLLKTKDTKKEDKPNEFITKKLLTEEDLLRNIALDEDSSDEAQIKVVKSIPCFIKLMKSPCEKAQIIAIENNPAYLQDIINPTNVVKIKTVYKASWAISYIDEPSEALQMAAVTNSPDAIHFIKNPCKKVQDYVNNI